MRTSLRIEAWLKYLGIMLVETARILHWIQPCWLVLLIGCQSVGYPLGTWRSAHAKAREERISNEYQEREREQEKEYDRYIRSR